MTRARSRWNGEFDAAQDQQAHKRRLILREAGAAFNERGFHNVSLDEVGQRLGISKTVCYYYFRDKNHLLLSCVEIGFELAEQALASAEQVPAPGIDRVVEFVRQYVRGITSELGTCAVLNELTSLHADDLKAVRARQRAFGRRLLALVQQGLADGSIAVDDAKSACGWILSGPLMIPRVPQFLRGRATGDLADDYAEFTRRSLAPRGVA